MKFHLEASFRLSGDASAAEDDIAKFLADAGPILQKGAPEGHGARIEEWKLDQNRIDLTIESDRYVRAHDALLRLRRPLSELLGK
jgi:seryl-tRNA synthetase